MYTKHCSVICYVNFFCQMLSDCVYVNFYFISLSFQFDLQDFKKMSPLLSLYIISLSHSSAHVRVQFFPGNFEYVSLFLIYFQRPFSFSIFHLFSVIIAVFNQKNIYKYISVSHFFFFRNLKIDHFFLSTRCTSRCLYGKNLKKKNNYIF